MIEFLTSPILYVSTTTVCIIALAHSWKTERSICLFRGALALALAGNAIMLGVTVAA